MRLAQGIDKVPVKVTPGEAILPVKTVQKLGVTNVRNMIARTNDGKVPRLGIRAGGKYAVGSTPPDDDAYNRAMDNSVPSQVLSSVGAGVKNMFSQTDFGASGAANEAQQNFNSGDTAQGAGAMVRSGALATGQGVADVAKAAILPIQAAGYGIGTAAGATVDSGGRFLKGLFGIKDNSATAPVAAPVVASTPVAATSASPATAAPQKFSPLGGVKNIDWSKFGNTDAQPSAQPNALAQPPVNQNQVQPGFGRQRPAANSNIGEGIQTGISQQQAYFDRLNAQANAEIMGAAPGQDRSAMIHKWQALSPAFGSNNFGSLQEQGASNANTNAAGIQREEMSQAGATKREEEGQAGALARTSAEVAQREKQAELSSQDIRKNQHTSYMTEPNPETGLMRKIPLLSQYNGQTGQMETTRLDSGSGLASQNSVASRPIGSISTVDGKSAKWDGKQWQPL